jgi:hypothetical protein
VLLLLQVVHLDLKFGQLAVLVPKLFVLLLQLLQLLLDLAISVAELSVQRFFAGLQLVLLLLQ